MANKLNIVLIGESYVQGMAGSNRIQNFIDNFPNKKNHNFSNLIIKNPNESISYDLEGHHNGVNYKVIKYNIYNIISVLKFFRDGIKFISSSFRKGQKNIIYLYESPSFNNIVFIIFAKYKQFKIIIDIVEDTFLNFRPKSLGSRIKNSSSLFFLKRIQNLAHGCIVISFQLLKNIKKISKGKIPVFHLPISVDFSFFSNSIVKSDPDIKIFYGGSFGQKDGFEFLINAFVNVSAKYRSVKLILTGKGNKHDMDNAFNLIESTQISHRINYLGFVEKKEYYQVINQCDIFCMTRVDSQFANTGFPFKLGEMLATGKAVISTTVGDVKNYLIHEESALLIPPDNEIALTNAIIFLIENPSVSIRIGENGKKVAKEHFDAKNLSEELYSILLSL